MKDGMTQEINSASTTKKSTSKITELLKPCHVAPCEIYPGLFIGSKYDADLMAYVYNVDVLVPLDSLEGTIWEPLEKGGERWKGDILYIPIKDFGILPTEVLLEKVERVINLLKRGKKVGIFCLGGHGRTGYFTAVVLGRLGIEDPVEFLRTRYCEKAIESQGQLEHIAEVLDKPEIAIKHKPAKSSLGTKGKYSLGFDEDVYFDYLYGYGYSSKAEGAPSSEAPAITTKSTKEEDKV